VSAYTPIRKTFLSSSLTVATTAYTAGDQAGAQMTVAAIGGANGYVLVNDVNMTDNSARINAHELRVFNATTTPAADNAAASWSDADMAKRVGGILYSGSIVVDSLNSSVDYSFKPFLAQCDASGNLYVCIVLRAVPVSNFFAAVGDLNFAMTAFQVS
jgi:hypothetical protein